MGKRRYLSHYRPIFSPRSIGWPAQKSPAPLSLNECSVSTSGSEPASGSMRATWSALMPLPTGSMRRPKMSSGTSGWMSRRLHGTGWWGAESCIASSNPEGIQSGTGFLSS